MKTNAAQLPDLIFDDKVRGPDEATIEHNAIPQSPSAHAQNVSPSPATLSVGNSEFDRGSFENFIDAVGLDRSKLCFQTWQEKPDKKQKRSLGRTLMGPGALGDAVVAHDRDGFALGVMLCSTTGRGRKTADILGINVLVVDLDGLALPINWPGNLVPSLINVTSELDGVSTNGMAGKRIRHHHLIWKLDREISPAEAQRLTRLMARLLGGDLNATAITQPFRVPGSVHRGHPHQPPFRVYTAHTSSSVYKKEVIEAAYPDTSGVSAAAGSKEGLAQCQIPAIPNSSAHVERLSAEQALLASVEEALSYYSLIDYHEWIITTGFAVHAATRGSENGFAIWADASANAPNAASYQELRDKWSTFKLDGLVTAATLFDGARMRGCDLSALGRKFPTARWLIDNQIGGKQPSGTAISKLVIRTASNFTKVSNARCLTILWHSLTSSDKQVFDALHRLHNGFNNGRIVASASVLSTLSGVCQRQVGKSLIKLKDQDLIITTFTGGLGYNGGFSSNTYQLSDIGSGERIGKEDYPEPPRVVWSALPLIDRWVD
jgi:hypothetical protein